MHRRVATALAASALLLAAAPAAHATVIATVAAPTTISAYGGRVVWSAYLHATGRWHLVQYVAGEVVPLPIPPRTVPFDVDLGPGQRGGVLAVYSRCGEEVALPDVPFAVPTFTPYGRGVGCDLYEVSLAGGAERKLDGPSSPDGSEFWPTVWRDRVAFARTFPLRAGERGLRTYLYERARAVRGRTRRVKGGPQGDRGDGGPIGLDLRGRTLAYAWRHSRGENNIRGRIKVVSTTGRTNEVVAVVNDPGATMFGLRSAQLLPGYVHFTISGCEDDDNLGSRLYRRRTDGGRLQASPLSLRINPAELSVAIDDRRTWFVQPRADSGGYCGTSAVAFNINRIPTPDYKRYRPAG